MLVIEAYIAAILIALLSLVGVLFFGKSRQLRGVHRYILPFAVGIFLGVVLFELIPETLEGSHELGPVAILIGFLGFYLLSYFLETFHHHQEDLSNFHMGTSAYKLLIGDAVHNIADGIVIAGAFLLDPVIGIAATIGIALHEIPQEIAEFGVLIEAGLSTKRAALYNLLSASSIILGVLLAMLFVGHFEEWLFMITGIAAGNLLYIATADLIPELRKSHKDHFWQAFITTVLGTVLIGALLSYSHEFTAGKKPGEETELHDMK